MSERSLTALRSHTWLGGLSVQRETVWIAGAHRLQVRLEHNAYRSQSSAICKRWSGERWETVCRIPPEHMRSWRAGLTYSCPLDDFDEPFTQDEAQLLTDAMRILEDTHV